MSSNGNIFRVTGPLCGNSPFTGEFTSQSPVTRSFDAFFDLAGDLRRHRAHYDVTVMLGRFVELIFSTVSSFISSFMTSLRIYIDVEISEYI